jgi:hypothetical protein
MSSISDSSARSRHTSSNITVSEIGEMHFSLVPDAIARQTTFRAGTIMDWLQFISAVIGHLAWPALIIALLIVLRRHVEALADRLEDFSFGGAKFVWKKALYGGSRDHQRR